jgi:nucleoside-triphosphatase
MITDIKIGITGLPGAGKTKTLLRVIEMLSVEELKIGGMVTEPIMDGRRKVGFSVIDIIKKESQVYAHIDIESRITDGRLGVDLSKFESIAVHAIRHACETCDIIVIDEVGKVEVESQAFIDAVKHTLDAGKPMILTLHKKSRNPLLQDIRRRDDVRILEVTPTNRNLLPHKIIRLMNGENM